MNTRIYQNFEKWISLLVVVVVTGGCGNDRPTFDPSKLPVAENLYCVSSWRNIVVEGFPDSGDFYIGDENFSGVEALCRRISSINGKMEGDEEISLYFQLPKSFPAEMLVRICNETTPELNSGRVPVYLECLSKAAQEDQVAEMPKTRTFIMGPIVSNLDRVSSKKEVFLQTLEIATDYYLFGDKKFQNS